MRARLPDTPTVLDLACGSGRHALLLARHGCRVFAVDRDRARIEVLMREARAEHLPVRAWIQDLEHIVLPPERFDAVLVTNYLQRDLWPSIRAAIRAGGFLVYETFTVAQIALGYGPRSPDHLLEHGELRRAVPGWTIELDEEVDSPLGQARLIARKPRAG